MTVVSAVLLIRDGKVLISGCDKHVYGGFRWEFPGGKLEMGESPESALKRELTEELGIHVRVFPIYDAVRFTDPESGFDVLVLFYPAELLSGEPRALEGQTLVWASPSELSGYPFAQADERVTKRIAREGLSR